MERFIGRGNLADNKRKIVAGTALAGAVFFGQAVIQSEGHEPYKSQPIDLKSFKPVVIPINPYDNLSHSIEIVIPDNTPTPEIKLTKKEQKVENLKDKRDYWLGLAKDSGKFSTNNLKDMQIYLPYYLAAGEKFDIDWRVLYVNHQRESGGSDKNSKAFDGSTYPYVNGMQLNVNYWTPEYQKSAVEKGKNFSFLEDYFPVRHKSDMKSIFAAAKLIGANEDVIFKRTRNESDSIRFGFVRFSGSIDSGEARYQEYRRINKIFNNQIDEIINQ